MKSPKPFRCDKTITYTAFNQILSMYLCIYGSPIIIYITNHTYELPCLQAIKCHQTRMEDTYTHNGPQSLVQIIRNKPKNKLVNLQPKRDNSLTSFPFLLFPSKHSSFFHSSILSFLSVDASSACTNAFSHFHNVSRQKDKSMIEFFWALILNLIGGRLSKTVIDAVQRCPYIFGAISQIQFLRPHRVSMYMLYYAIIMDHVKKKESFAPLKCE